MTPPANAPRDLDRDQDITSETPPVVVIGAGPTGLSAAYHLGADALLVEREDTVGGWCRSIEADGFTFDFAGHIMFSNDPYVHEMYEMLLGDNVHWQNREAWVYSKNVYTRYPFQGALYGLPPEVIKECLIGAIEARFGDIKATPAAPPAPAGNTQVAASTAKQTSTSGNGNGKHPHNGNGHSTGKGNGLPAMNTRGLMTSGNGHAGGNGHSNPSGNPETEVNVTASSARREAASLMNSRCRVTPGQSDKDALELDDCCGDGIMESTAELVTPKTAPSSSTSAASNGSTAPANFEEFIYKVWGRGIARHFAIPYNRKLWAVPLTEMETSWLGGRVPLPDLEEMIDGALSPVGKPMGPNARFGYPLKGGFQALMDGFLPKLEGPLLLGTSITGFSPIRRELTLSTGETINYEQLISTMPLPTLIRLAGKEVPAEIQAAAKGLRYISVRCVNLGVGRENITDKHWIYYPEDSVFHRIFVQGNASPHCNPAGGFGLTCEITYHHDYKPLPCEGQALIDRCIEDCRKVGIIRHDDPILTSNEVDMPHAYVIYDHNRAKFVKMIREWLSAYDVVLAGRYSEWEYYNSDHAFLAGKKAADKVRELRQGTAASASASAAALPG